jgi:hypothetical protein
MSSPDPENEFEKLVALLTDLGKTLGAHHDIGRQVLIANQLAVVLSKTLGQELGLRVEVTTDPNLGQRMDEVLRVNPYRAEERGSVLKERSSSPLFSIGRGASHR